MRRQMLGREDSKCFQSFREHCRWELAPLSVLTMSGCPVKRPLRAVEPDPLLTNIIRCPLCCVVGRYLTPG